MSAGPDQSALQHAHTYILLFIDINKGYGGEINYLQLYGLGV